MDNTKNTLTEEVDVLSLSCELSGVSAGLTVLRNAFAEGGCYFSNSTVSSYLFGLQEHVERIINDLDKLATCRLVTDSDN